MTERAARRALLPLVLVLAVTAVTAGVGALVLGAEAAGAAAPAGDRSPYGEMNLAWTEPGMIGLVGWAKDPDVDRPIDVVVAVDNALYVRRAGVYNPYLPGTYAQKFRSYLVAVDVGPGHHTMCVAALNVGRGSPFRLLGCQVFDVVSASPVGNLEAATVNADFASATVSGWALDPETAMPLPVTVTVDGADAVRTVAADERADVAAAYPSTGSRHGFAVRVPLRPGAHRLCVRAQNVGRGSDAVVSCTDVAVPDVLPRGNVEAVVVGDGHLRVEGWVADPDSAGPLGVRLSAYRAGAVGDPVTVTTTTTVVRPDVTAVTGLTALSGIDVEIPVDEPGTWFVCAVGLNAAAGADTLVDCDAAVVVDHRPIGTVDGIEPSGSSAVRVRGWSGDPDAAGTVTARLVVDGVTTTVAANQPRADVAAAHPSLGAARGFDTTVSGLSAGRHTVCVTFVDLGGSLPGLTGDREKPCGTVLLGTTSVGTVGATGAAVAVGPRLAAAVERDGGVSSRLRDGSTLWLFGDTTRRNPDGSLAFFVGGTAAWAPATDATGTRDAFDANGVPYRLATPGSDFPACSASRPNRVMWPVSAVTVPAGARDRVLVFLSDMCLGTGPNEFDFVGMAVAEWYYDPQDPPDRRPVQLTVLDGDLDVPLTRPYGSAAALDADGRLNLYACGRPANPLDVAGFGLCRVARVDPALVTDTRQYRYWNGSSWVTDASSAAAMTMPAGPALGYDAPAAAFTVTFDPGAGAYVMAYSPWPGFVDQATVRVARDPQGPWTAPVAIALPDCDDTVQGATATCYAVTAQPQLSAPGVLGLGWFDQATAGTNWPGEYRAARVAFTVAGN